MNREWVWSPIAVIKPLSRSGVNFANGDMGHPVAGGDGVNEVDAFNDFAEHGVDAVQMRLWRQDDKKLAAVGVGAGVCHGQCAARVFEWITLGLAVELVSWPAAAGACRVAALNDEIGDHSVKCHAVIKAFTGEKHKVVDRPRGVLRGQLHDDGAFGRGNVGGVALAGVDGHGGRGMPLFVHVLAFKGRVEEWAMGPGTHHDGSRPVQ